jgi:serine/threonine-protein kinase
MLNQLKNVEPLQVGGQKEVFSARHPQHGDVVYKVIKKSSDSYERTKREIVAVANINSPNVPKIYAHNVADINPDPLWILEERISGLTLRELLTRGDRFNTSDVVRFLETCLEILVLAENNSLVHRDIKPNNIILSDRGEFYLIDFGIARHLDLESITATNSPFGVFTIGYASSEQFKNLKSEIDIRADLFSLGVVANEMFTGQNYYVQASNRDMMKILYLQENNSLPPLRIDGDPEYQLSTFISLLGDHRRTRRPRTAAEALSIFKTVKQTLK